MGSPPPVVFRFDNLGSRYDVVVTVSFNYRASADDRFSAGATLLTSGGRRIHLSPALRFVSPSPSFSSTTLVWRATGLSSATRYSLILGVGVQRLSGSRAAFVSTRTLVVIDGTPSG
jgi:hypothetical protein